MVATASSFTNSRYIACPGQGSDGGVRINYNGYYSTGVLLCGGLTVFTCTHLFSLMARPLLLPVFLLTPSLATRR